MTTLTSKSVTAEGEAIAGVRPATIVGLSSDGRLELRVQLAADRTEPATARAAHIAGYRPTVGDRVLVAGDGAQSWYAIAVLHPARPLALALDDGTKAELSDGGLELRDAEGRLLVRYADGCAEVCAPSGDLKLAAPAGKVRLHAGLDVDIEAARDVTQRAARRLELDAAGEQTLRLEPQRTHLSASRLNVEARDSRLASSRATIIAGTISTTAERLAQNVGRYELHANKLVEKATDSFRTVVGLAQQKLGRVRTVVQQKYSLRARRTVIVSEKDTSIDGERVLLG